MAFLSWFIFSVVATALNHEWRAVAFTLSFGALYGGSVLAAGRQIRNALSSWGLIRFPVFISVAIAVSVAEETYAYALGVRIAIPVLWQDLIIVPGEWAAWFAAWYLIIARKFAFTDIEAAASAGITGLLFEYAGAPATLADPLATIVAIPLTVAVYSAIFSLPLQFMKFNGLSASRWKYPVAVLLPYLLSLPATVALFILINPAPP